VARQPLLHDLVATVHAPTSALSGGDGQIRASGVQGVFHADSRVLSEALLRLDGHEPEAIGHAPAGAGATRFVALARRLGRVRVERTRRVRAGAMDEHIRIVSTADRPVSTTVTLDLAADLAPLGVVRSGRDAEPAAPTAPGRWAGDGITVTYAGPVRPDPAGRVTWPVRLAPAGSAELTWRIAATDERAVVCEPTGEVEWQRPDVLADDQRIVRLVGRSLDDLAALRLAETGRPADTFLGAGVPWYLTLFGRDSIWAARMMLPLGTGLARSTLRALAHRQGARIDPDTDEAPGKVMHELRVPRAGLFLPATYYGTIDATLLWVSLLHDAWRWGLPAGDVQPLLPHLEAALGWLADHADPDHDGFVEYFDTSGRGLANQGWKDSGDAVRFHDGRPAQPPIALAEVQGYACRAALDGAALLDAFDRPGGAKWRGYAAALADRFRAKFWVAGGYPALALDRDKRPVDSLTSNIGHLLGTGLLDAGEERAIASALAEQSMSGGFGLRTMSARDHGYDPLSYHCGSVWTHDTAIVAAGLARSGHHAPAATLVEGLLAAAETFGYRLPELYAGFGRDELSRPMPYPTACRPQAWSAASAILLLQTQLGLHPDVPNGRVSVRPLGPISVRGLRIAGHPLDITVDAGLTATVTGLPAGLSVEQ
jgi:glycogen debranching enzyme